MVFNDVLLDIQVELKTTLPTVQSRIILKVSLLNMIRKLYNTKRYYKSGRSYVHPIRLNDNTVLLYSTFLSNRNEWHVLLLLVWTMLILNVQHDSMLQNNIIKISFQGSNSNDRTRLRSSKTKAILCPAID